MKLSWEQAIDIAKRFAEAQQSAELPQGRELQLNAGFDPARRQWVVTFDPAPPPDDLMRRSMEAMRAGRRDEALSLGREWMRQRSGPAVMGGTGGPPPLLIVIVDDETGLASCSPVAL